MKKKNDPIRIVAQVIAAFLVWLEKTGKYLVIMSAIGLAILGLTAISTWLGVSKFQISIVCGVLAAIRLITLPPLEDNHNENEEEKGE